MCKNNRTHLKYYSNISLYVVKNNWHSILNLKIKYLTVFVSITYINTTSKILVNYVTIGSDTELPRKKHQLEQCVYVFKGQMYAALNSTSECTS